MKQQLQKLLFTSLFIVTTHLVTAQTFVQGDLKYTVNSGTVRVEMDTSCPTDDLVIPSTVDNAGATYNVSSIAPQGFKNCTGLTSITIPNSVTLINFSAFQGCSSLTTVTIPNSVTQMGDRAFQATGLAIYGWTVS